MPNQIDDLKMQFFLFMQRVALKSHTPFNSVPAFMSLQHLALLPEFSAGRLKVENRPQILIPLSRTEINLIGSMAQRGWLHQHSKAKRLTSSELMRHVARGQPVPGNMKGPSYSVLRLSNTGVNVLREMLAVSKALAQDMGDEHPSMG